MPGMLRAFVAVELPGPVRAALQAIQAELERIGIRARWVQPERIHLTLKFLGSVPAGHVESIGRALAAAARAHAPMSLTAVGLGVFPGVRRPRVIWAGIAERGDALGGLQREIDARLSGLGFPAEAGRFRGHLTIGRFVAERSPGPVAEALKQFAGQAAGSFAVREVVLFRSDLLPEGPRYTPLARTPLGAAEEPGSGS
ncbi:MAG: RNA 2',3'-cyclic phosphodiesterase [Desulfobacterales bacterium]|jgi:2'-5' RNA ligase|nr:RNA 2',3'-cyclic phosphodiesterase [Desulfobacterales bacterium]